MLTNFETLEQYATDHNIRLYTQPLPHPIKGLYFSREDFHAITLSSHLETTAQRATVLAEELGHYHTTPINLFAAPPELSATYEHRAAAWAANVLVPLPSIVKAWREGVRDLWELSEHLGVPEDFTVRSIELHRARCGMSARVDKYLITFDLLHVREV